MRCFVCDGEKAEISLAGWHITQRFNICKDCLKRVGKLKPGECLEWKSIADSS